MLSGAWDDGTPGLARGGVAAVQDPEEALHASMPRSALAHNDIQHVHPVAELAKLIAELAVEEIAGTGPLLTEGTAMAAAEPLTTDELGLPPSGFACPDCHRVLFELCRVGPRAGSTARWGAPGPRSHGWPSRTSSWRTRCGWRCGRWRRRPR
ncbi:hypothetical protein JOF53_001871 [Crossiella equi]|uniref:CheB-type methylesterase domain-containing protein n=1 Tax=Crossiella equi TaxID=130796 RepID=A0ABS5A8V2_9PSEU|nr:chemotaxis protein CheB [Crossiella equi]MBP2472999.1 hypothetical protein [Crossiella equi]